LLVVNSLTKKVATPNGELLILDNINMSVEKAQSVAIIGASGSGKSTLLSLLAGLDSPSSGSVTIDGQRVDHLNEEQRAKLRQDRIGFIFQSFHLIPALNALDNVMLPLELKGQKNACQKAQHLLDRVGLSERYTHKPSQLSGGEQQRVAIARAFASEPDILFADEPTGNLDQSSGETIIDLLFKLNREQAATLILVTHDQALADACQRQFRLDHGCISELTFHSVSKISSGIKDESA